MTKIKKTDIEGPVKPSLLLRSLLLRSHCFAFAFFVWCPPPPSVFFLFYLNCMAAPGCDSTKRPRRRLLGPHHRHYRPRCWRSEEAAWPRRPESRYCVYIFFSENYIIFEKYNVVYNLRVLLIYRASSTLLLYYSKKLIQFCVCFGCGLVSLNRRFSRHFFFFALAH